MARITKKLQDRTFGIVHAFEEVRKTMKKVTLDPQHLLFNRLLNMFGCIFEYIYIGYFKENSMNLKKKTF